ncbi:MAG: TylF/MycF/NovP-related O-methyltransferase, partial [Pseudonocardiaceae bacterium]
ASLFAQSNITPPYSDGPDAFEALLDNIKLTHVERSNQIPTSTAASNLNTAFADVAKYIEPGATVPVTTRAERAAALTHAAALLVDSLIHETSGYMANFSMPTWNAHMQAEDYAKLLEDVEYQLCGGARSVGVLGLTPVTTRILRSLAPSGLLHAVQAVYVPDDEPATSLLAVPVRRFGELAKAQHDVLVVAADAEKEDFLLAALPYIKGKPRVIVAGYAHLSFRDKLFIEEREKLLVPSLANGYPNTLTHLYQCLTNAARLGINGVVAEFGMFKGGTTMFLSRIIEKLGMNWLVIGFDTFGGFPPRRSPLDMYDHPDCVFTDLPAVKRYLDGRNVEVVVGDIVKTCNRLDGEELVLSFIDTDNYSSASAALEVVQDRTVVGGAIVFDHFTGINRFRYTLGERIAGSVLLEDPRYFHLHDTGVFYRQR